MRGHNVIRGSIALAALLALLVFGGAAAASAQTTPGGYTGGTSVQGSVDQNPNPPSVASAPAPAPAGRLAFTGADVVLPMVVGGATFLLVGALAVGLTRSRRPSTTPT